MRRLRSLVEGVSRPIFCVAGMMVLCFAAHAAEQSMSAEPTIGDLIADLDAPDFASRRVASQKLVSMGKDVYAALADAAITRGAETVQRAIEILRVGLHQSDVPTKDAAKKELERIALSENPSAARAAQAILHELVRPKVANRSLTPAQMGFLIRAGRVQPIPVRRQANPRRPRPAPPFFPR